MIPGQVYAGGDEEIVRQQGRQQATLLRAGMICLAIPLNGGSQTRRDKREDWRAIAARSGLAIEEYGHQVILRANL